MSSWFDTQSETPLIAEMARNLDSFLAAVADGKVTTQEVSAQEDRVVAIMKKLEPELARHPVLHAQVTELLVELTAYDLMQMMSMLRESRQSKQKLVL
ncbi:MAG: hypothetical protein SFX18_03315 [Pirellulales bacterium]|nr:hypothetical protein [Pirellulales bacterium]